MRRALALLLPVVLLLASSVPAWAAPGDRLWNVRYREGKDRVTDEAIAIVTSPDGSTVFTLGRSSRTWDRPSSVLRAYDPADGALRWATRVAGWTPRDLTVSADGATLVATGDVLVTFVPDSLVDTDVRTVAFSAASGDVVWTATAGEGRLDQGRAVVATADTAIVTGRLNGTTPDTITKAYDLATGDERWTAIHGGGGADFGLDVALSPDGTSAFVAGKMGKFAAVTSYDVATGAELWSAEVTAPDGRRTDAQWVSVSDDGSEVFAAGHTSSGDNIVFALDAADGTPDWTTVVAIGRQDISRSAAYSDAVDTLFLEGTTATWDAELNDYVYTTTVIALDTTTGAVRWSSPVEACSWNGPIEATPDGTALVVGCSARVPVGIAMIALALATDTGAPSWVSSFGGGRRSAGATDLTVAPSGETVFVLGGLGLDAGDVVTLAYAMV